MRIRYPFRSVTLILFCSILQLACTSSRQQAQTSAGAETRLKTYVFECKDKSSFTVQIENDRAWVFLPVGYVSVPRVPASSGAKYSDGKSSIWFRGKDALIQLGGRAHGICTNNPLEAVWEQAKLEGADFRAVGGNPKWSLEIHDSEKIVFVMNPGTKRYEFPLAHSALENAAPVATYQARNGTQQIKVVVLEQECRDASSGKKFEQTVTVSLDGKSYKGCGKALQ